MHNISIAPGNQLLVTDQGLEGFPDLKVDPGQEEIFVTLLMSSFKSLVTYPPSKQ